MESRVLSRRALARLTVLGGAALAMPAVIRARADEPIRLRCSLDTAPSHVRNVSVADYLRKVEAASGGRIKTELFASGQLFADLNVGKALIQGQVEMACPGLWTQTGFVPDGDFIQLPVLYGRTLAEAHRAFDGSAGARTNEELERKLMVHVVGKWVDLGYQSWFSTHKPLASLADLKDLKIRSPGGAGIAWRIRFVGGIPNTTAWPNVPLALSQGTFDGLVSTNLSCATAQLWEAGVRHAYEDRQFIGAYVPMTSKTFWDKLDPGLRNTMTEIWEQNIAAYRAAAATEQVNARKTMEAHDVVFADASEEQIAGTRKTMMAEQDAMAKEIKVSPEMVKLVMQDLGLAA